MKKKQYQLVWPILSETGLVNLWIVWNLNQSEEDGRKLLLNPFTDTKPLMKVYLSTMEQNNLLFVCWLNHDLLNLMIFPPWQFHEIFLQKDAHCLVIHLMKLGMFFLFCDWLMIFFTRQIDDLLYIEECLLNFKYDGKVFQLAVFASAHTGIQPVQWLKTDWSQYWDATSHA